MSFIPTKYKKIYDFVGAFAGVVVVISTFIGGIMWLASVESTAQAANTGVSELKESYGDFSNTQIKYNQEFIDRLSRIEQGVNILLEENKKRK